jgi:hypothetical protein
MKKLASEEGRHLQANSCTEIYRDQHETFSIVLEAENAEEGEPTIASRPTVLPKESFRTGGIKPLKS